MGENTALIDLKTKALDTVTARIQDLQSKGRLDMPEDYSAGNALQSAWLIIQQTVDKNEKPALTVCDTPSVCNALLDMVVMGLNPSKKQLYFMVAKDKLVMMPSYFGYASMAKRADKNIEDVFAEVVYEGDVFKYKIKHGIKIITDHEQDPANIHKDKIKYAYCTILYKNGDERSAVMTIEEIKQAWQQSPMKPFDEKGKLKENTTHFKFPAEMCKRTVTKKVCKPVINSSNDSYLKQAINAATETITETRVEQEINENANNQTIDIEATVIIDATETSSKETSGNGITPDDVSHIGGPDF